jgi:hypothetical protein
LYGLRVIRFAAAIASLTSCGALSGAIAVRPSDESFARADGLPCGGS